MVAVRCGELRETVDLRRRVLGWVPPFAPHDTAGAVHLVALADPARVVGVASCGLQEFRGWAGPGGAAYRAAPAVRLWGVAVEVGWRGSGVGRALVGAAAAQASGWGAELLWASARVEAVGFYEHLGFAEVGPATVSPLSGLVNRFVVAAVRV
jgi:GNAT superfamily N-acetyltransferase